MKTYMFSVVYFVYMYILFYTLANFEFYVHNKQKVSGLVYDYLNSLLL